MRYTRFAGFLIPLTLLGLAATLPILALAGTFQQVVSGEVTPEIDLKVILANCGMLQVGKAYYWADDGVSVEANTNGPTIGAQEVIETNVRCSLEMRYAREYQHGASYLSYWWERHVDVYDPKTGEDLGSFSPKNIDAVTIFLDQDNQFGNGNEVALEEGDENTRVANSDRPLLENMKLYLAVRADSFGSAEHAGKWHIPFEIYAYVVP
jgi:hypothetical protein